MDTARCGRRTSCFGLRGHHPSDEMAELMIKSSLPLRSRAATAPLLNWVRRPRVLMTVNWIGQFTLVFALLFFQGMNTPHGLVTMGLSPARMIEIFGFADAGSYLQAAQNLVANGRIVPEWQWVYNLWPPGMVWLDALSMRFSPLSYGLTIGLVTTLVWSIVLALLTWPFIRTLRSAALVFVLELLVLSTSPFQSWMFDEGLFYADGLAAGLFLIGLILIVNRARQPAPLQSWIRDGLFAGTAFASSIYLRASYQLVPYALGAVALVVAVLALIAHLKKTDSAPLVRQAVLVATAALSVAILMQPYSFFVQRTMDRAQFVQTEDLVYEHAWEDPATDTIPQWMRDGGSTVGCDIDPVQCAVLKSEASAGQPPTSEALKDSLIAAILAHPLEFVANRVPVVAQQWFGDELDSYSHVETDFTSGPVSYSSSENLNPAQGLFYLSLLLVALATSIMLAVRGRWVLLVFPILALVLLAPFAIVHVEVRYLMPLKLMGLLAPLLYLTWHQDRIAKRSSIPPVKTDS